MIQIMCAGVIYEAPEIKYKKGGEIICEDGSTGVITEVRRKSIPCKDGGGWVQAGDLDCVFARPKHMKYNEEIPTGLLITATAWHPTDDGKLRGSWVGERGLNNHIAEIKE